MRDPRYDRLAEVLVGYSAEVKAGDVVRVAGPTVARALIVAICRAVIRAGGMPHVEMVPDEVRQLLLDEGSDEQLRFENPIRQFAVENVDVSIGLWGEDNTKALSRADPQRLAMLSQAGRKFLDAFLKRSADGELRWTGAQFPCHAAAQDAEMSLSQYEAFLFAACLANEDDPAAAWRDISRRQQRAVDYLNGKHELRFVTPQGTDLRLGIEGRTWINCDGHNNMPDGEIFTGPDEAATEGVVCYSFPAVHEGREVDGIRMVFREGRVVDASAEKGEEFLMAMLDQDPGARILGEVAIGTNYSIREYSKNTLFDEKIGGTFHAALGAAYPESGGTNESGLHWDMVCDLRTGGRVFVDGELISENGRFLDETWPRP